MSGEQVMALPALGGSSSFHYPYDGCLTLDLVIGKKNMLGSKIMNTNHEKMAYLLP